jgi:hypothetical protein
MEVKAFKGQNYAELISRHSRNRLFEDSLFPPCDKSLYYSKLAPRGIAWKRPKVKTKK